MADAYARQVGWLEAKALHKEELRESARITEEKENTFEPTMIARRRSAAASPRKPSGLVASDPATASHLRRYAAAREEKSRAAAALTWSSTSRARKPPAAAAAAVVVPRLDDPPEPATPQRAQSSMSSVANTLRSASPRHPPTPPDHRPDLEDDVDDDVDVDADDESFFEELQRERARWDREQSKLLTVIELQQRELSSRGLKAEERAKAIATAFTDAVTQFEQRLIKLEGDVDSDLSSIRKVADRLLEATDRVERVQKVEPPRALPPPSAAPDSHRLDALERQLASVNSKLEAVLHNFSTLKPDAFASRV